MGKIKIIGKYDLENNNWVLGNNQNNDISLAIANYEPIRNNDSDKYDYIIYSYGSRVEDHSKDGINIKDSEARVNNILNYFKNKNHNIIVKFIMLDKDAPLKSDALILAKYINKLCKRNNCNSINILGYSKSAVMFFDMIKHINKNNLGKINLYNVATPYIGTKMASPKIFYNDVKTAIDSHLPSKLADSVYKHLINYYEGISSNSHMDYDISLPNGVLEDRLDKYDETLIRDLLLEDNLNAIKNINRFENYTTGIDKTTLKRALKTLNFNGIGLCLIDDIFMGKNSDGFVHTKSEEVISDYLNINNKHIKGAHHDMMGDRLYYDDLLYSINKNIIDDKELQSKSVKKF